MKPKFWKLSQGPNHFTHEELLDSIVQRIVYVHMDTKPKATSQQSQGQDFIEAAVGDYFYMTNGNKGIYVFGRALPFNSDVTM